ncbi:MAG: urea ABC transporter permease subunit UrtB [Sterolibacterium sp.]|jgi:urea transport system permease protein
MKPILLALLLWLFALPSFAALDPAVVQQLAAEDSDLKIAAIQKLAQSADGQALKVLKAMNEEALFAAGDQVFLKDKDQAVDAASGAAITPPPENADSVTINNRVRGELAGALAALRLFSPERHMRLAAAKELTLSLASEPDAGMAPMLARARDQESDDKVKAALAQAYALATLKHADAAARLDAVKALAGSGDPNIKLLLLATMEPANEAEVTVRRAAIAAHAEVKSRLALGETVGRIFSGLSLGSILLLAALGLAITYGVMGVINMAHGELLMIGAYAAYFMQGLFRSYLPGWLDWYVVAAIPVAFLAAAAVGVLLERTVIRWLYGRPLETLLATWGLSLILIQAARVLFGAQNVEVANPSWMSGGIELMPSIVLPLNRIVIVGFALLVLALVWVLMNRTRLGLFVRAVTQNRAMAGCVGVPTARIDSVAFALGAGIAGLGGVALSQIANVGPDMGQGYIVDSFMVVVLGGVGQLAGAVWAALGLGVVSKFLEGWAGAVVAKIVVLVFIIMFIQKRPQGLFALKGRFVET